MNDSLENKQILFFDGTCALCHFWVRFCLDRDFDKELYFAPLQGNTAIQLLEKSLREQTDSAVFLKNGTTYLKSQAILMALRQIGYAPDLLFLLRLIPTKYLDSLYDAIAKRRLQFFGKNSEFCPMVSTEQQRQILN